MSFYTPDDMLLDPRACIREQLCAAKEQYGNMPALTFPNISVRVSVKYDMARDIFETASAEVAILLFSSSEEPTFVSPAKLRQCIESTFFQSGLRDICRVLNPLWENTIVAVGHTVPWCYIDCLLKVLFNIDRMALNQAMLPSQAMIPPFWFVGTGTPPPMHWNRRVGWSVCTPLLNGWLRYIQG